MTYTGTLGVTTGNEIPADTSVLNNVTINNSGGVSLGMDTTVNGSLTLASGALSKVETTPLLTVEETLDALRRAQSIGYRAPAT